MGFGVASLTLIVTAVDRAERKAVELVEWFGPDAALVFGGNFKKRAAGMRTNTLTSRFNLDRKDYRAMRIKCLEPLFMNAQVENLRAFLRMSHHLVDRDASLA